MDYIKILIELKANHILNYLIKLKQWRSTNLQKLVGKIIYEEINQL